MLAHARPGHLDVRVSERVGRELGQRRCGKLWRDFRRRARTERCAVSAGPYLLFLFSLPPTLSLPPSLSRGRVCVQRVFCVRVCFAPGSTGSHDASVEVRGPVLLLGCVAPPLIGTRCFAGCDRALLGCWRPLPLSVASFGVRGN